MLSQEESAKRCTVFLTHVESDGPLLKFWGQVTSNHENPVKTVIDLHKSWFDSGRGLIHPSALYVGLICCCKFTDGNYYRAKIININPAFSGKAVVFFPDYGNTAYVTVEALRQVSESYISYLLHCPEFAQPFYLSGIVSMNAKWNTADIDFIQQTFCYEDFTYEILGMIKKYHIIELHDLQNQKISEILIRQHLGKPISREDQEMLIYSPTDKHSKRTVQTIEPISLVHNSSQTEHNSMILLKKLELNSVHKVVVSHIGDGPVNFAIHLDSCMKSLYILEKELNEVTLEKIDYCLLPGLCCLCKCETSQQLRRGVIVGVTPHKCSVYYTDYGYTEELAFTDIFKLPNKYIFQEAKALRFVLSGFENSEVSDYVKLIFHDIVMGEKLKLIVVPPKKPLSLQCGKLFKGSSCVFDLLNSEINGSICPLISEGNVVEGFISHVDSVQSFFIQLQIRQEKLDVLMDSISDYVSHAPLLNICDLRIGLICCAKYSADNLWYRAEIMAIFKKEIEVRFIDYGNIERVDHESLRKINLSLIKEKPFAFHCCLDGFQNSEPDSFLTAKLEQLSAEITFRCKVIGLKDDLYYVTLFDAYNNEISMFGCADDENSNIQQCHKPPSNSFSPSKICFDTSTSGNTQKGKTNISTKCTCNNGNRSREIDDTQYTHSTVYDKSYPVVYCEENNETRTQLLKKRTKENEGFRRVESNLNSSNKNGSVDFQSTNTEDHLSVNRKCSYSKRDKFSHKKEPPQIEKSKRSENYLPVKYTKECLEPMNNTKANYEENLDSFVTLPVNSKVTSFQTIDPCSYNQNCYDEFVRKENITVHSLKTGGKTNVIVSNVISPNDFWLQLESNIDVLQQLQSVVQVSGISKIGYPQEGELCLGKYEEEWYRALVLEANENYVKVLYVDYGNSEVITDEDKLRYLSTEKHAPYCAYHCSLNLSEKNVNEITEKFENILFEVDYHVKAEILEEKDGLLIVDLYIDNKSISQILRELNDACTCSTTVTSCFNHGYITYVESPSMFYIQDVKNTEMLQYISLELEKAELFNEVDMINDDMCAALFNVDEQWYRGRIITSKDQNAEILFIDFGNSSTCNQIKKLPDYICAIPPLAKSYCLKVPPGLKQWSQKATEELINLSDDGNRLFEYKVSSDAQEILESLLIDGKDVYSELAKYSVIEDDISEENVNKSYNTFLPMYLPDSKMVESVVEPPVKNNVSTELNPQIMNLYNANFLSDKTYKVIFGKCEAKLRDFQISKEIIFENQNFGTVVNKVLSGGPISCFSSLKNNYQLKEIECNSTFSDINTFINDKILTIKIDLGNELQFTYNDLVYVLNNATSCNFDLLSQSQITNLNDNHHGNKQVVPWKGSSENVWKKVLLFIARSLRKDGLTNCYRDIYFRSPGDDVD